MYFGTPRKPELVGILRRFSHGLMIRRTLPEPLNRWNSSTNPPVSRSMIFSGA